ncbi:hypothetical protein [Rickettsiella massiliensis]|uniref:hypothetical protein n=1 Tax=Rickettsiella massiliensis TaxID=676517 RepID=UPI00052558A0|nr:hypothetical protein [Rickettsiella massiliensis]
MGTMRADKDIIYIWVNKTEFIYNTKDFPFLQNIISHAVSGRNIHIIIYQSSNLDQLDKNIQGLQTNLLSANLKNIYIYKLEALFSNQPELVQLVSNLLENCKSLANPIDLVKVMIGANLEKLKLNQGLLADMDCIIPENIILDTPSLSIFPLIDEKLEFERDYAGIINCYIENGFSLVFHRKNKVFNEILNEIIAKNLDYFYEKPNDAVYSIYVEKLIQYFTKSEEINDQLMKKYRQFSDLPESVKIELANPLQDIIYMRGGSWGEKTKNAAKQNIPLVFMAGSQPVYPFELDNLSTNVLFHRLDNALLLLKKLVKKGWDVNEKLEWINDLQEKESIVYHLLERNSKVQGDKLKTACNIVMFLMQNGLKADDKLLSFFKKIYEPKELSKSKELREAFKEYARVFANTYRLNYGQMLFNTNIDKATNDDKSQSLFVAPKCSFFKQDGQESSKLSATVSIPANYQM